MLNIGIFGGRKYYTRKHLERAMVYRINVSRGGGIRMEEIFSKDDTRKEENILKRKIFLKEKI